MNHKLLLGSTALVGAGVLFTNAASAQDLEVSLSGYTEFLAAYANNETLINGTPDRDYLFTQDTEIWVRAEGTSDTGVTYGSYIELEAGALPMIADEMNLYFSGAFGRIEIGRQDSAADNMVLDASIISAGTAGVDGDTDNQTTFANIQNSADATKVTYFTPRVAGFQLGASFTPDTGDGNDDEETGDVTGDFENMLEGGANWVGEFAGLETGLFAVGSWADQEDPLEDDEMLAYGGGGTIGFAGLDFAASYGLSEYGDDSEIEFVVAGVGYGFGPINTSFSWEHNWVDGDDTTQAGGISNDGANIYVLAADLGLMPGVTLKGDVSYNDDDPFSNDDDSLAGILAVQLSY